MGAQHFQIPAIMGGERDHVVHADPRFANCWIASTAARSPHDLRRPHTVPQPPHLRDEAPDLPPDQLRSPRALASHSFSSLSMNGATMSLPLTPMAGSPTTKMRPEVRSWPR